MNKYKEKGKIRTKISVIITTRNRPELLKRAIKSVITQVYKAYEIIVINDSDKKNYLKTKTVIEEFVNILSIKEFKAPLANNPCCSWNEGGKIAQGDFLAFLDDDDEWLPNYLLECVKLQIKNDSDLVLAGFWRKRENRKIKPDFLPPNKLSVNLAYIQNIGLRTSNLFIRKKIFLEINGFDEKLAASTDRDISIRLANYKNLKYQPLKKRLVIYHKHRKNQMINRKNPKRFQGTLSFLAKYSNQMTLIQKKFALYRVWKFWGLDLFESYNLEKFKFSNVFLTRKIEDLIFSWIERESNSQELEKYYFRCYKKYLTLLSKTNFDEILIKAWQEISKQFENEYNIYLESNNKFPIVIGMVNTNRPDSLVNFLNSLLQEINLWGLDESLLKNGKLIVKILDNSNQKFEQENKKIVYLAKKTGLNIEINNIKDYVLDYDNDLKNKDLPFSIAESRRILNQKLASSDLPNNSVVWILDDTFQFGNIILRNNSIERRYLFDAFNTIWFIGNNFQDIKILIGENTGSAPLPILSTINKQIFDLKENIIRIIKRKPDNLYKFNLKKQHFNKENYYYDFSNSTRLPYPYLLKKGTNKEILFSILENISNSLSGYSLTRPLVLKNSNKLFLKNIKKKTIYRGGNTLIFDLKVIKENIHPIPFYNDKIIRRSDMIWTIQRSQQGIIANKSPIILQKKKNCNFVVIEDIIENLIADIYGHVYYKWLYNKIKRKSHSRIFNKRKAKILKTLNKSIKNIYTIKENLSKIEFWINSGFEESIFVSSIKWLNFLEYLIIKAKEEVISLNEIDPMNFSIMN